ncbi:hypothetical protein [Tissierella sp.]|uniref:hypothetical protein n=1 Tax=Tissierella sp. TaxID=41274 RepID=UPI00285DD4EB|nr:hypothetical protein [Tissierella sp.]MDR7855479.1 hypothetical protein [Tissierella sp.]
MKKLKKCLALFLTLMLILSNFSISFAIEDTNPIKLNKLGLLDDISPQVLDKNLSRMIGLTMILRSLGYTEETVNKRADSCPFTDVPEWFKGWATMAVDLSITSGVSQGKFDPNGLLTEKMFYSLQLRALGYDKDEAWNNTETLGINAGIIKKGDSLNSKSFTKRDASEVMLAALNSKVQGQDIKLIDKLIADKVVDENKAIEVGLIQKAFDFKDGETITLKNVTQMSMSSNGKVVIWKDLISMPYDEDEEDFYSKDESTGEMFIISNYIRGLKLDTGETFTIPYKGSKYFRPIISSNGKTIIWSEYNSSGAESMVGKNLETGKKFIICEDIGYRSFWQLSPDGKLVFWHDNLSGERINWHDDIYGKDLETGKEFVVCEAEGDQWIEGISEDGNIIIWTDYRNWDVDEKRFVHIRAKDLNTDKELVIDADRMGFPMPFRNRYSTSMSSDGKIAVYFRTWSKTIFSGEIFAFNLETGKEFVVCGEETGGYKENLIISDNGKIAVWEDNRNGNKYESSYSSLDIYGFNLETMEEFVICNKPGIQEDPKISSDGKIVVWQDRDKNKGIKIICGRNIETGKDFEVSGFGRLIDISSDGRVVIWEDSNDVYIKNINNLTK